MPAVGGATEDLERPDFEEREDQAFNEEEKVFEAVFERDPSGTWPPLYRPATPVRRCENHLFRHFLDGSFRSFFLGTMLEGNRETPVHYAQVGACLLQRQDDGSVRRVALEVRHVLMAGRKRLSDQVWQRLEDLTTQAGIRLVDLTESDVVSSLLAESDLRNKAAGKVRFEMHKLEASMIELALAESSPNRWLVADGSLLFSPIFSTLTRGDEVKPVIGVAKNFRKDPQFVCGRGPRGERRSLYRLLADLESQHRTAAFAARGGKVVFWYVRLREQRQLDYPLMGVVKVEMGNPSQEPVPSDLIDSLSRCLVAERRVTPHGQDRRWHAHLYPIFLAERAVKEGLLGRDVVQQYLKWR